MADFDVDVTRWVEKARKNMDAALRGIAEAAVARVKSLTPVRTGYLRANWTATLNDEAIPTPQSNGAGTMRLLDAKAGDVVVISNPVQYARRIEYGFVGTDERGRVQNQQGRGMVQQTVAELPAIADGVIKRLAP